MKRMHVKKGDTVVVISGANKGKTGKVLAACPKDGRVIVENVNMVTKHVKPRGVGQQGGRVEKEGPLYASNVMLYCDKCKKGTRVAYKFLEDGTKARVCKKCGETFES
jgi:large subunit ribosomal protein L24